MEGGEQNSAKFHSFIHSIHSFREAYSHLFFLEMENVIYFENKAMEGSLEVSSQTPFTTFHWFLDLTAIQ